MANRIVLGKANDGSSDVYGLWLSKPGVNIVNGSGVLCDEEDMLIDSRKGKFASVLANQNGTGSVQSVTVPAGKRLMLFINPSDSRCRHYATQTVSSNTMSITVSNGVKYVLMNIEAGDS
jgi:hypothetical protein|tara:strand:- start:509 stop:868 length:360 start_codon:yes stop_codon:yes gene_type:complete